MICLVSWFVLYVFNLIHWEFDSPMENFHVPDPPPVIPLKRILWIELSAPPKLKCCHRKEETGNLDAHFQTGKTQEIYLEICSFQLRHLAGLRSVYSLIRVLILRQLVKGMTAGGNINILLKKEPVLIDDSIHSYLSHPVKRKPVMWNGILKWIWIFPIGSTLKWVQFLQYPVFTPV